LFRFIKGYKLSKEFRQLTSVLLLDCVMAKINYLINLRYLPYLGFVTILLNDYPTLKWSVIGLMVIMVIVAKDP